MRIRQSLAADRDEIGLPILQDRFGLRTIENGANCHCWDARLAPDRLRMRHLVAPFHLLALLHIVHKRVLGPDAAGRAIDQVHAPRLQLLREYKTILYRPAIRPVVEILAPIDAGQSEEDRLVGRPIGPDALRSLSANRMRPWMSPPYSSSRKLATGERKEWIR